MTRYTLVPSQCRVDVDAHTTLHDVHGHADGLTGVLEATVDEDGQVVLTAPYSAHVELPVDRIRAGNDLLDTELRRRIDARRHPQVVGAVRRVVAAPDGRYLVTGDLSFHGVTRPVEGSAEVRVGDGTLRVDGELGLDVRDFGITPPRLLMLRVEPEVVVRVALVAAQES